MGGDTMTDRENAPYWDAWDAKDAEKQGKKPCEQCGGYETAHKGACLYALFDQAEIATAPPAPYKGSDHPAVIHNLNKACDHIAAMAPDTGRNARLNGLAFVMAGYIAAGHIGEEVVYDRLYSAGIACRLPEPEVRKILRSNDNGALTRGRQFPRDPEHIMVPAVTILASSSDSGPKGESKVPLNEVPLDQLLRIRTAADITIRRVIYLWEGRIPLGAMTLLPGEEGIGKTTVGIRIMADLTRGRLKGEYHGTPRSVLIAATEDGLEDVFVPRLQQAGADMTRVHFIQARLTESGDNMDVIIPRDLNVLGRAVEEYDAALLWIDSLVTTLPDEMKTIAYKDTAKVLRALNNWAEDNHVAACAPWHLNKHHGSDTALRIMDSRAFRTAVRSMLLVVADPDAEEDGPLQGIVALDKANAGTLNIPALRYQITPAHYTVTEVDEDTGEIFDIPTSCGVAHWVGSIEGDGRDLARSFLAPHIEKEHSPAHWLRDHLKQHGEVTRQSIFKAAKEAGFSESAIKRASQSIGVISSEQSGQNKDGTPWRAAMWRLNPPVGSSSRSTSHDTRTTGPTDPTGESENDPSESI